MGDMNHVCSYKGGEPSDINIDVDPMGTEYTSPLSQKKKKRVYIPSTNIIHVFILLLQKV